MSLLTIVQNVCLDLGLESPTSVVGNSNEKFKQLLAIANREGQDLSRRTSWHALRKRNTFSLVASASQGALNGTVVSAGDFGWIIDETFNNLTKQQPIIGPIDATEIEDNQTLSIAGPYQRWYRLGANLYIDPTPTATDSCQFEYVSTFWCTDSTGATGRTAFAADGDVSLLDETLIELGITWRWLRRKGMDYSEEYATYESRVADAIARERAGKRVYLDGHLPRLGPGVTIPPGSWNL